VLAVCLMSSDKCIWNWYFSLLSIAVNRLPASYPVSPVCFFPFPLHYPTILNLPKLGSNAYVVI